MPDDTELSCPMCGSATDEEAVASQQLVISAALALIEGHGQTITDCAAVATPYDFHLAVTMYVEMVEYIAEMREKLNQEAAGGV